MDEKKTKLPRRWKSPFWRKLPLWFQWWLLQKEKIHLEKIRPFIREQEIVIDTQWVYDTRSIDEELRINLTDRLRRKAERLYVPLPDIPYTENGREDENWERGYISEIPYLTPEGAKKVRKEIYEAKKHRQDIFLPWLTLCIGLAGALTGLIAMLKK